MATVGRELGCKENKMTLSAVIGCNQLVEIMFEDSSEGFQYISCPC